MTSNLRVPNALVDVILDPQRMKDLVPRQWENTLSCARRNSVLAYLAQRAESVGILDQLPEVPCAALRSARIAAARLAQLARWELERVCRVLAPAGIPIIALKGIAYILRGMPHATTRILTDIDIMVPADHIDVAEQALIAGGWQGTKLDPYDQKYYRRWSHEIPPLHYPGRLLGVDVHHTICPTASRLRPDPQRLWADSEPTETGVRVLSRSDSVLHAAIHLFFDSDFDSRFRDLIDLHELLAAFANDDAFWNTLVARAREQGVGRPLYYAFETLASVLGTPIPEAARSEVRQFRPPRPIDLWMKRTLQRVLTPADPARWPPQHRGLLWLLYVRSHWLRMPPYALAIHLTRKAVRGSRESTVDV
jgi:Uncharacterised nucleotidyltransferase